MAPWERWRVAGYIASHVFQASQIACTVLAVYYTMQGPAGAFYGGTPLYFELASSAAPTLAMPAQPWLDNATCAIVRTDAPPADANAYCAAAADSCLAGICNTTMAAGASWSGIWQAESAPLFLASNLQGTCRMPAEGLDGYAALLTMSALPAILYVYIGLSGAAFLLSAVFRRRQKDDGSRSMFLFTVALMISAMSYTLLAMCLAVTLQAGCVECMRLAACPPGSPLTCNAALPMPLAVVSLALTVVVSVHWLLFMVYVYEMGGCGGRGVRSSNACARRSAGCSICLLLPCTAVVLLGSPFMFSLLLSTPDKAVVFFGVIEEQAWTSLMLAITLTGTISQSLIFFIPIFAQFMCCCRCARRRQARVGVEKGSGSKIELGSTDNIEVNSK
mgnify:CR=1 FL=1